MLFIRGNLVENKEGDFLGRAERNGIYDSSGDEILKIDDNEIKNLLGTTIAYVKKGSIFSTSGHEYSKVSDARLAFNGSNHLPGVVVAALWLSLVKGIT